jgi:hypothetical protein
MIVEAQNEECRQSPFEDCRRWGGSGALCALHVDIALIALWLGHASIQTTPCYIEADLAIKERALQKLAPAGKAVTRFKADDVCVRCYNPGQTFIKSSARARRMFLI